MNQNLAKTNIRLIFKTSLLKHIYICTFIIILVLDYSDKYYNKKEQDEEGEDEELEDEEGEDEEDPSSSYTTTILKNPGQDLDLGYTNSKGQHNAIRGHTDRRRFIIKEKINIYPDTLCWIRDNTFSNGEHMAKSYFYSNAYDNYPVVGVTWPQA